MDKEILGILETDLTHNDLVQVKTYITYLEGQLSKKIQELQEIKEATGYVENPKIEYNSLRHLFFRRYRQKAADLRGTDRTEDGKLIRPAWSGKEGNLLKHDLAKTGSRELIRCMELFFSDQVTSVSQFTRFKTGAGYSYAVFHSMIEKLQVFRGKPQTPCEDCGKWKGHTSSCNMWNTAIAARDAEKDEASKIRDENPDLDISGMFKKHLRGEVKSLQEDIGEQN
jgi:hypothetical protein